LESSQGEDPLQRTSFHEMYDVLSNDATEFEDNEDLKELSMWVEELKEEGDSSGGRSRSRIEEAYRFLYCIYPSILTPI
jgi:hypothetical protein